MVSPGVFRNWVTSQYLGSDFPRLFCMRMHHNLLPNGFRTAKSERYPIFWYAICCGGALNDLTLLKRSSRRSPRPQVLKDMIGSHRDGSSFLWSLSQFLNQFPGIHMGISARIQVSARASEADYWSCLVEFCERCQVLVRPTVTTSSHALIQRLFFYLR